MLYWTRYDLPRGGVQHTTIYARHKAHAEETMRLRGMGECLHFQFVSAEPVAPEMPSELFKAGKLLEAQHALVWVAMIAARAGILDPNDALMDDGILHKMSHFVTFFNPDLKYEYLRAHARLELLDELQDLEARTPGVAPSWGGVGISLEKSAAELSDHYKASAVVSAKDFSESLSKIQALAPPVKPKKKKFADRVDAERTEQREAALAKNMALLKRNKLTSSSGTKTMFDIEAYRDGASVTWRNINLRPQQVYSAEITCRIPCEITAIEAVSA